MRATTALALEVMVGNAPEFGSSRQFASWSLAVELEWQEPSSSTSSRWSSGSRGSPKCAALAWPGTRRARSWRRVGPTSIWPGLIWHEYVLLGRTGRLQSLGAGSDAKPCLLRLDKRAVLIKARRPFEIEWLFSVAADRIPLTRPCLQSRRRPPAGKEYLARTAPSDSALQLPRSHFQWCRSLRQGPPTWRPVGVLR